MGVINLEQALVVARETLAQGVETRSHPLTTAVLDPGGLGLLLGPLRANRRAGPLGQ